MSLLISSRREGSPTTRFLTTRTCWALLAFGCVWGGLSTPSVRAEAPVTYRIAAGPVDGPYHRMGLAIAEVAERAGLAFRVTVNAKTNGTVGNLKLLARGEVDLAIGQADGAFYAATGSPRVLGKHRAYGRHIRALTALYDEQLHIILRRPIHLRGLRDVAGKTLDIGPTDSGSRFTSTLVLESLGLTVDELGDDLRSHQPSEHPLSFARGELDVVMAVNSAPSPLFCTLLRRRVFGATESQERVCEDGPCSGSEHICSDPNLRLGELFSLDPATVKQITSRSPELIPVRIPRGSYPGQLQDVHTVGVRALLLAHATQMKAAHATALMEVLGDIAHMEGLSPVTRAVLEQIVPHRMQDGVRIPFHHGASSYLETPWRTFSSLGEAWIWTQTQVSRHWTEFTALLIVLMWLILLLVHRSLAHKRRVDFYQRLIHRRRSQLYLLVCVLSFGSAALLTWSAEYAINAHFARFEQALWSVLVWLLSGFEDRAPVTPWGQVGSVIVMASWAAFILLLANVIVGQSVREFFEGDRIPDHLEGHYVICHWNERAHGVIRQLRSQELQTRDGFRHVVVIDPERVNTRALRAAGGDTMQDVLFITGDPGEIPNLERAAVHQAQGVVVLADDRIGEEHADGKTLLILKALERMALDAIRSKDSQSIRGANRLTERLLRVQRTKAPIHVVTEAVWKEHRDQFSKLTQGAAWGADHAEGGLVLETLTVKDVEARIFSQVARCSGLSQLYFELTSFSADENGNEVYRAPAPSWLVGKTFGEAALTLLDKQGPPVTLVGLAPNHLGGSIQTNPWERSAEGVELAGGDHEVISEGHDIVFIADDPLDIERTS